MSLTLPPRILLSQTPTPLQRLRFSPFRNPRAPQIWVKRDDLTGSVLTGNKVRKLEFVLAAAQAAGCDTLITTGGVQSNHCRATAIAGAQLGFKVHLILRGEDQEVADGNLLLDKLCGAEVSCYPRRGFSESLDSRFVDLEQSYAREGRKAMCIPTGASNGVGIWGYINACSELLADFAHHDIDPGHLITATGSGGTQAGLSCGMSLKDSPIKVWGVNVCDDEAWFQAKVRDDIADWRLRYPECGDPGEYAVRVIDGYVGAGYGKASTEVFTAIRDVACSDGLILDPVYTGKAFHAMCQEIEAGRFDDSESIVFLHTGGVFGLFPQREQICPH